MLCSQHSLPQNKKLGIVASSFNKYEPVQFFTSGVCWSEMHIVTILALMTNESIYNKMFSILSAEVGRAMNM
jgi:hypothetical protein